MSDFIQKLWFCLSVPAVFTRLVAAVGLVTVTVLQLISCASDAPIVMPKPLLEQQLTSVPLVFPDAPLASHSLNTGGNAAESWHDWLHRLQEPDLISSPVSDSPVELSGTQIHRLQAQASSWLPWTEERAKKGDVTAQIILGMAMEQGVLLPRNEVQSQYWLKQAAESGDGFAAWQLVVTQLKDARISGRQQTNPDPVTLEKWLTQAAEKGVPQASLVLAQFYRDGTGLVQNLPKARQWYERATHQPVTPLQTNALENLGLMEWFGIGGTKNTTSAQQHWLQAAEQGSALAAYLAALIQPDTPSAQNEQLLKQAAREHISGAFNQLGVSHWYKQDYTSAANWFENGREAGDMTATYNVGMCYFTGLGRTPSADRALVSVYEAAGHGNRNARRLAGFLYWQGPEQGTVDFLRARTFFQEAAEQGDIYSRYALGLIYGIGQGVTRDLPVAWANFAVAAAWGMHEAATLRELVAEHMNTQQKEEGRKRAQTLFDNYREAGASLDVARQPPPIAGSLAKPKG